MLKPGERFNQLVVLGNPVKKSNNWYYDFKCDCGKTKQIRGSSVSSGSTKTCGCGIGIVRFEDKIIPPGTVFGSLTVVEMTDTPNHIKTKNQRFYRCVCKCGKERIIRASKLRAGKCRCDCVIREQIEKTREEKLNQTHKICSSCLIEKPINDFYFRSGGIRQGICKTCNYENKKEWYDKNSDKIKQYSNSYRSSILGKFQEIKRSAKIRDLEFSLSIEDFESLIGQCYYCGQKNTTRGLDRIDNDKGYTLDNVVSCCKICNFMKGSLSQSYFYKQVERIANRISNNTIEIL